MKDYEIIEVNEDSKEKLFRLLEWRKTGKENIDLIKKNEYGTLCSDYFKVLVVEKDDQFIAYITITIIPKPDERLGTLYVDELWVPQKYRRRGLAKALIEKASEYAKDMGLWRVRLIVGYENTNAREFYKSVGFVESSAMFCEKNL
ncbi:GNAT family N-acetyltransferase [Mycoplasmatota bacterium]|nr:GNAT family N-acetyltransferase [Mycoplasmatota bacterium]